MALPSDSLAVPRVIATDLSHDSLDPGCRTRILDDIASMWTRITGICKC